jgi:hypothetical protein
MKLSKKPTTAPRRNGFTYEGDASGLIEPMGLGCLAELDA